MDTQTKQYRLETALDCLNNLLAQGWLWPHALKRTIESFAVSEKELIELYDKP
jgi:hypothetical protein